MQVASSALPGLMEIVCMDWFAGRAPTNRPVLVICYKNGILLLMKCCTEEGENNIHFLLCVLNFF